MKVTVITVGELYEQLTIGYWFIDNEEAIIKEIVDKDHVEILIE